MKFCIYFIERINVYVFSGFVSHDKIESYIENRERFIKKGKGTDFRTAVQHMDEYVVNKVVSESLFHLILK